MCLIWLDSDLNNVLKMKIRILLEPGIIVLVRTYVYPAILDMGPMIPDSCLIASLFYMTRLEYNI